MRNSFLALVAFLTILGGTVAVATAFSHANVVRADDDDCDSSGSGKGGCDDNENDNDDHGGHGGDDDQDDEAAQTALAQPVGTNEIRIIDERYVPNTITIRAGEAVTFVNADDDEHTATGPGFDTGKMLPGDSITITFDEPGTFDFTCQFHPEMRGQVIVQSNGSPVASAAASPFAATTASPITSASRDAVSIDIVDFAFAKPALTVAPGTTVTWTNTGVAPHTVSGLATESGTIEPGQSFSFTFTEIGTFPYRCAFHPQMTGQVTVDPNAPPSGG